MAQSTSLLRPKFLFSLAFALLFTPIPTKLGFWKFVFHSLDPALVGIFPCTVPSPDDWGFTLEDLYGGGNGDGDGSPSQREQRAYRNRLWGQTALVTGANSGTGYEIALALARLGVRVTLACRNPTKCEAAVEKIKSDPIFLERSKNDRGIWYDDYDDKQDDGKDVDPYVTSMTVDTSSLKSVQTFCEEFLEKMQGVPLDMLFLNAGIGAIPQLPDGTNKLSVDGIEITFATNVVGHHLMYKLLARAILTHQREVPARIVLTSSSASYGDYIALDLDSLNNDPIDGMSHYGMSKLAQIWWARELTSQFDKDATSDDPNSIVYINAGHPGAAATNIWDNIINPTSSFGKAFLKYVKSYMWTSEEGALTLLYLGTAVEDLQKKKVRGKYFHPQTFEVTEHKHVYANEEETLVRQKKLWKFLDDLVAGYLA